MKPALREFIGGVLFGLPLAILWALAILWKSGAL
jgi:hypothetical protein